MSNVFVPAVRYAGSEFLRRVLRGDGRIDAERQLGNSRVRRGVGRSVIFEYVTPQNATRLSAMIKTHSTVAPLRDPLMSLILCAEAAPKRVDEQVPAWLAFALIDRPSVFYVPVDLPDDEPARVNRINRALAHVGLRNRDWAAHVGRTWGDREAWGAGDLRRSYADRDVRALRRLLPAVGDLARAQDALRPLLEREGYFDLIWYR